MTDADRNTRRLANAVAEALMRPPGAVYFDPLGRRHRDGVLDTERRHSAMAPMTPEDRYAWNGANPGPLDVEQAFTALNALRTKVHAAGDLFGPAVEAAVIGSAGFGGRIDAVDEVLRSEHRRRCDAEEAHHDLDVEAERLRRELDAAQDAYDVEAARASRLDQALYDVDRLEHLVDALTGALRTAWTYGHRRGARSIGSTLGNFRRRAMEHAHAAAREAGR